MSGSTIALMRRLLLLPVVVCLAGCTAVVAGQANRFVPLSEPPDRPITQILPDQVELSRTLSSPMQARYGGRPGGVQVLPNGMAGAVPVECIKVHAPAMRHTYRQAPVRAAIRITWKTDTDHVRFPTPNLRTTFGVIEFDTTDSARTWYRLFAADWRHCQGETAVIRTASYTLRYDIGRTSDAGDLLTTVLMLSGTNGARPMPVQRALAQVSRYLIDVEVMDTAHSGDPSEAVATQRAEAITELISEKINADGHV